MRSIISRAIGAVCVAVIGFGGVAAIGSPVAYAEPDPSSEPSIPGIGGFPGFPSSGSSSGGDGGGGGHQSTIPVYEAPESTVGGQTPIVVRRTPGTPGDVPPPVVIPQPDPVYEPDPVYTPVDMPPVEAPVVAPPPVPVAVPVPPPVELPVLPEPPAAPPLPVPASPQILLTSSAEPGTQALTLILMFLVAGVWVFGHRIASHSTLVKATDAKTA